MKRYVLLGTCTLFFFGIGVQEISAQINTNECHTIRATSDVPSGYASPVNLFGSSLLMRTTCPENGSVVATVGDGSSNQYIYKYGYQRIDGAWERFEYSGNTKKDSWIIGSATAQLQTQDVSETGTYIAYICQKVEGRWRCGCSDESCKKAGWQIQKYDADEVNNEPNFSSELEEGESYDKSALTDMLKWESDELDIHYPSKYVAEPGEKVVLTGMGFGTDGGIEVLWNGKTEQEGVRSTDGRLLEIVVPDLDTGKYEVDVRKDGETSEYNTIIWIGTGENDPKITNITPTTIEQGDTITIHGTGFDQNNNDVLTSAKAYNEVASSDGETITFTYDPYKKRRKMRNLDAEHVEYEEPISVTIVNTKGVSNTMKFYLKYD